MLRRRADVKQPTETTSPESTAAHFGHSPVSPLSAVETVAEPAELETIDWPTELQADIHCLSVACRGASL